MAGNPACNRVILETLKDTVLPLLTRFPIQELPSYSHRCHFYSKLFHSESVPALGSLEVHDCFGGSDGIRLPPTLKKFPVGFGNGSVLNTRYFYSSAIQIIIGTENILTAKTYAPLQDGLQQYSLFSPYTPFVSYIPHQTAFERSLHPESHKSNLNKDRRKHWSLRSM